MDNKELAALFTGYGYQPRFVEDLDDIDADLSASMEWVTHLRPASSSMDTTFVNLPRSLLLTLVRLSLRSGRFRKLLAPGGPLLNHDGQC